MGRGRIDQSAVRPVVDARRLGVTLQQRGPRLIADHPIGLELALLLERDDSLRRAPAELAVDRTGIVSRAPQRELQRLHPPAYVRVSLIEGRFIAHPSSLPEPRQTGKWCRS